MTNWDNIVKDKELSKAAKLRKSPYYEMKNYTSSKEDMISQLLQYKKRKD